VDGATDREGAKDRDGVGVGCIDGVSVGKGVGLSVGCSVGGKEMVGRLVGWSEGREEGEVGD
jgi:hypothetical protein